MALQANISIMDHANYMAAVACAEQRALHSFFDQHIIEEEGNYLSLDEGDYDNLPMHIIDRIVYTVPGAMNDEY